MDFNKVIIAGRFTRDPEVKYLDSGNAFGVWGMAINRYYNEITVSVSKRSVLLTSKRLVAKPKSSQTT